jgi:PKHD-type hydroxylase
VRSNWDTHCWKENVFTPDECKKVLGMKKRWKAGETRNKDKKHRHSKVSWIRQTDETVWIYNKLIWAMDSLNKSFLHLDWDQWIEDIQLTRYSPGDHYTWHMDVGAGKDTSRKLSCSVLLNNSYKGGEFEFFTGSEPSSLPNAVGKVIVFPSYTLHRVCPVTKGVRYSLVAWGHGARLR